VAKEKTIRKNCFAEGCFSQGVFFRRKKGFQIAKQFWFFPRLFSARKKGFFSQMFGYF
jgi:hypothetical protein